MLRSLKIRQIISANLFFFGPFFTWIIIGAILLGLFTESELFFAVNQSFSPMLDKLNTVFSAYGRGDIIPIILLSLFFIPAFRHKHYFSTITFFGILIPTTIFLLKLYFNTPRPLKSYGLEKVHTVPWLDNLFETSFPSGHTIGAFGFFLLLSLYLPKHYKPWSLLFFCLALSTAYSRLYLGQHFFADVYAGSIIGTLLTLLIYSISHHFNPKMPFHD